MTKTTTILAFSVVLALVIGIISSGSIVDAAKPGTETGPSEVFVTNNVTQPIPVTGIPSSVVCPVENLKIVTGYTLLPSLTIQHATEPNFGSSAILFVVNDLDEVITDRAQDAADRLNELGYFVDDGGGPRAITSSDVATAGGINSQNTICIAS